MRLVSSLMCALAVWLGVSVTPSTLHAASFTPLGDLPGGIFFSSAIGVSGDGGAGGGPLVVGLVSSAGGFEAFAWDGSMVGLGDLAGGNFSSQANDVSADGEVIVGFGTSASGREASSVISSGSMVSLGDLAGGIVDSRANGVSADGSVIVGDGNSPTTTISGHRTEAFRWTSGGMVGLGGLGGGECRCAGVGGGVFSCFTSGAAGVSRDGSVVVGKTCPPVGSGGIFHAFRWTAGDGMVGLGDLPGGLFDSDARAISADGSVIVGSGRSAAGFEAFRWTSDGGMVSLGDLPGGAVNAAAQGASADGSVIVGFAESASGAEAFIWDRANGMQSLAEVLNAAGIDLTGFSLDAANAVSEDGRSIVGSGDGFNEGWLATLDCPGDDDCDTVLDADDNCPGLRTTNIADADGNGTGDACECGDQTGDGFVNIADILAINRVIFELEAATPLCDADDDDDCDVGDILAVNGRIFGAEAYCARHPTPEPKTVFITSEIYTGALGGLAGADALCNGHAGDAGLSGTYMAWLGTGAATPNTRFTRSAAPYVRTDGVTIASDYADLTDGSLLAPIDVDEFASPIPAGEREIGAAWSAVDAFGDLAPFTDDRRCGEWTSGTIPDQGFKGDPGAVDATWAGAFMASFNCQTQPARLYCFEQ